MLVLSLEKCFLVTLLGSMDAHQPKQLRHGNYAMAPFLRDSLVEYLQQNPFSPEIDGSSDTGTNRDTKRE